MKRLLVLFVVVFVAITFGACGDDSNPITVIFTPVNGATVQTLDVAITATFSSAVTTEPSLTTFTLKKDDADDSLCTTVTYDSSTKAATCAHDLLLPESSYTSAITGISGVNNASATFSTLMPTTVSSATKTSVTSASGGSITITYALAAVPEAAPAFSVVTSGGEALTTSCELSADGLTDICTVSGVAGCDTFTDYTATIAGSVEEDVMSFNSADNEFEDEAQLTDCWTETSSGGTAVVSNGELTLTVPVAIENQQVGYGLINYDLTDVAMSFYLSSATRDVKSDVMISASNVVSSSGLAIVMATDSSAKMWVIGYMNPDDSIDEVAMPTGDLAATLTNDPPFYGCIAKYGDTMKYYISFDGESYTQLSGSNTMLVQGAGVVFTDSWASVPAITPSGFELSVVGRATNPGETIAVYDYTRFKTTGLDGTSADCPAL